jgi:Flp pilus assembly pilin Flp
MLRKSIRRFLTDESGANVVEYAVLSCIISVVVVSFAGSGLSLTDAFEKVAHLLGGDEVTTTVNE